MRRNRVQSRNFWWYLRFVVKAYTNQVEIRNSQNASEQSYDTWIPRLHQLHTPDQYQSTASSAWEGHHYMAWEKYSEQGSIKLFPKS